MTDPVAPSQEIKSKGEKFESIAFNFCKAATIALFTGRFTLPIAAGMATIFFLLAEFNGVHNSRCILKRPLVIACFWGWICAAWLFFYFVPVKLPLPHL